MEFNSAVGLAGIASLVQKAYFKASTAKAKKQRGQKTDVENIINKFQKDENGRAKPCTDVLIAFILYWHGKKNAGASFPIARNSNPQSHQLNMIRAPDGIFNFPNAIRASELEEDRDAMVLNSFQGFFEGPLSPVS